MSDVFFTNLRSRSENQNKLAKIEKLFDRAGFKEFIKADDMTAVKIHFGELGNDTFISPVYVRKVIDKIKNLGAKPFLTDTNTLYSGSRHNAVDHLETAIMHGFGYEVTGAPLIIADGLMGENSTEVEINKNHFKKVKIASTIVKADNMIVLSHVKGHEMAGFGGAIKNLAMGCAPAVGKRDQHSPRPVTNDEKCVGCGKCIKVCPQTAIELYNRKSKIDRNKCIGCGECMTVCPKKAFDLDWDTEITEFTERLTEYAYGAVKCNQNHIGFINFLMNITPDCDCCAWSDASMVPDIGILASKDPVAIDQASCDLINKQVILKNTYLDECSKKNSDEHDKFKIIHNNTRGTIQLSYGEKIGLGCREYNLIEIH